MTDTYLGIDVGTSRVKSTLVDGSGRVIRTGTDALPFRWDDRDCDITQRISGLVRRQLDAQDEESLQVRALCVASVAPALVAVSPARGTCRIVFSHLDPAENIAESPVAKFDDRLAVRERRSAVRFQASSTAIAASDLLAPLSSGLAYCLTGHAVRDAASEYELGLPAWDAPQPFLANSDESSQPSRWLTVGDDSVLATTDSVASAYGSGAHEAGDIMVYMGTYFSALELLIPLASIVRANRSIEAVPYQWRVSLPRFGDQIAMVLRMLEGKPVELAQLLDQWDHLLQTGVAATREDRPEWLVRPAGGTGSAALPRLSLSNLNPDTTREQVLIGLSLPLGRAIRAEFTPEERRSRRFSPAGGLSTLRGLRRRTELAGGIDLAHRDAAGDAIGAARLASRFATPDGRRSDD